MEDIQCSSEAGTQGHAAPIPNQETSTGRPFQPECVRAFLWPNVHCPGVDAILLVHMYELLGCLCLQSHCCSRCTSVIHRCTSVVHRCNTSNGASLLWHSAACHWHHLQRIHLVMHSTCANVRTVSAQLCLACAAAYAVLSYDRHKTPRKKQIL